MVLAARRSRRLSPELVGRREELAALEDELGRAGAGEFRLVLLLGDAGVGKSRLARELLARHREVTGLAAQAYPLAASAAFGLWTEAVDPFLRSLSDEQVVELCGGLLDDLATLFHRVALVRGSVPERDPSLPRLLHGLAGLLGNVARRRPLVVAARRRAPRGRVVVAGAALFRAPPSTTPGCSCSRRADLPSWLVTTSPPRCCSSSTRTRSCRACRSPRSARPGVSELAEAVIERPPPRALVDWLVERSQGNPLFAIGLLRALLDERGDLADPHLRRLPEGLTERVTSQLRRFDAAPRGLLERLAVVGRPVSLGDLTALTSSSLEDVEPMLAELVDGGHGRRGGVRQPAELRALSPARPRHRLPGDERRDPTRAAPAGGALAAARRAPGGGGAPLRPLGRTRRLGGGRGAAGRDAPGRAPRGVPGGAGPAGRAGRAAAGRRPALARGARGDVRRARRVADRSPRRDERAGRDQGAARDRRPARGLARSCPAGDRQVPPGQFPGLGHGRPRAGV